MIILGVDPGTIFTGYGIIEYTNNKFRRISHGVIRLPASKSLTQKRNY
jgi:crossover junction endodeoxyribonuclease RuvC